MTDLSALIGLVESGTKPDRSIDARVAVAVGDVVMRGNDERGYSFFEAPVKKGDWAFLSGCSRGIEDAYENLGACLGVQRYTSSLDAVLSLIEAKLPGWRWTAGHDGCESYATFQRWSGAPLLDAFATSPARALLAAALRAIQESRGAMLSAAGDGR